MANVTGGLNTDPGTNELLFNFEFDADRSLMANVSLGPIGDALGIALSSQIGVDASLAFDVSFGVDLTTGLSPEEAFFIRVSNFAAHLDAYGRVAGDRADAARLFRGRAGVGKHDDRCRFGRLARQSRFRSAGKHHAGRITGYVPRVAGVAQWQRLGERLDHRDAADSGHVSRRSARRRSASRPARRLCRRV